MKRLFCCAAILGMILEIGAAVTPAVQKKLSEVAVHLGKQELDAAAAILLPMLKNAKSPDDKILIMLQLQQLYNRKNDSKKALELLRSAYRTRTYGDVRKKVLNAVMGSRLSVAERESAARELSRIASDKNSQIRIYQFLGDMEMQKKRYGNAIRNYKRCLGMMPIKDRRYGDCVTRMMDCHLRNNAPSAAARVIDESQAAQLDAGVLPRYQMFFGDAVAKLKQPEKALEMYTQAENGSNPGLIPELRRRRFALLMETDKKKEAEAVLTGMLKFKQPENVSLDTKIGCAVFAAEELSKLEKFAPAREMLKQTEKAMVGKDGKPAQLTPDQFFNLRMKLAQVEERAGNKNDAIAALKSILDYDQAKAWQKDNASRTLNRVKNQETSGSLAESRKLLSRNKLNEALSAADTAVRKAAPGSTFLFDALWQKRLVLLRMKRDNEAYNIFNQKCLNGLTPELRARYYRQHGDYLRGCPQKDYDEIFASYEKGIKAAPSLDVAGWCYHGIVVSCMYSRDYWDRGIQEAEKAYQSAALKKNPGAELNVRSIHARILANKKQYEEAEKVLKLARERFSNPNYEAKLVWEECRLAMLSKESYDESVERMNAMLADKKIPESSKQWIVWECAQMLYSYKQYENSIPFFRRAMQDTRFNIGMRVNAALNAIRAATAAEKLDKGTTLVKQALQIPKLDENQRQQILLEQIQMEVKIGSVDTAREYFETLKENPKLNGNSRNRMKSLERSILSAEKNR